MNETKQIIGFEKYLIHKNGYVINSATGRIIKHCLISKGYKSVHLCNGAKPKSFYIHRLIALAFIDNPFNKPFVNHINGVMTDNRIENLEWCTAKENIIHAYATGLVPHETKVLQGAKLTCAEVIEIRSSYTKHGDYKRLSHLYKVSAATISNAVNRKTFYHI